MATEFYFETHLHSMLEQECIPIGCVPPTAVAIWGDQAPTPGTRHQPAAGTPPGPGTPPGQNHRRLWKYNNFVVGVNKYCRFNLINVFCRTPITHLYSRFHVQFIRSTVTGTATKAPSVLSDSNDLRHLPIDCQQVLNTKGGNCSLDVIRSDISKFPKLKVKGM